VEGPNLARPIMDYLETRGEIAFLDQPLLGPEALVEVSVTLNHKSLSDLQISLVSPGGSVVSLWQNNQPMFLSQGQITLTWTDTASVMASEVGSGPLPNRLKPLAPFSSFANEAPNGLWVLKITDSVLGIEGSMESWKIRFDCTFFSPFS